VLAFNTRVFQPQDRRDSCINRMTVLRLSAAVVAASSLFFSGCVSVDTKPTSMMTTKQSEPKPKEAALARTAIAAEFIKTGDLDAAQRSLSAALKSEPNLPEANLMMGVLLQQEGSEPNQPKAESYFKRAIDLRPDYAQARNNYGVWLGGRKRYPEAYTQFQLAGAQLGYAGRGSALENLGSTALILGKKDEAQQAFNQALQVSGDSLVARLELANIYLGQNRLQAARQMYDDYVQLLGAQSQSAHALWIGMRIAHETQESGRLQSLTDRLRIEYPDSPEYRHYTDVVKSGAVWD
jgi:type IV pilus assembly protein PilF